MHSTCHAPQLPCTPNCHPERSEAQPNEVEGPLCFTRKLISRSPRVSSIQPAASAHLLIDLQQLVQLSRVVCETCHPIARGATLPFHQNRMRQRPTTLRIAIDTGGTFTDCVWIDRGQVRLLKVFSTPADPAQAIAEAIQQIAAGASVTLLHGTTVGTNTILQRKGARVALVTTKGFEDAIEIGRQARPKLYDFFFDRVEPLVPANLRFGIAERTDSDGKILEQPAPDELESLAENIRAQHPEAIAITLLFSFANPTNELAIEKTLQALEHPALCLPQDSSGIPRVRTHQHGRRQRLPAARDAALPRKPRPAPRRSARIRLESDFRHAIQRRHHHSCHGSPPTRPHRALRPGRWSRRSLGHRPSQRTPPDHLLRHGRHLHRRRSRRRRSQGQQSVRNRRPPRRRAHARHPHRRRRRRFASPLRRSRSHARGPRVCRRRSRPHLLRPRHAAHGHRRQSAPRPPATRSLPGWKLPTGS